MTVGQGLMAGKRGLILGVANNRSIAWGIAKACADQGAQLGFSYQGDALKKRVEPLAAEVGAKLAEYLPGGLGERWIFASDDPDRLYFSVDRKWHGELPRTYFYDGAGGVRGMSGQVDAAWLANWARGVSR